jgi:Ca2+-binding RTX toxin-like protein
MESINSQIKNDLDLGNKSSRVSEVILELSPENPVPSKPDGVGLEPVDDLLIIDEEENKVAVKITATDVESLIPFLEELGFEVLGSAPELNFVEGFIPVTSITELESLSTEGLLGVLPVYQPITSVGSVTSQADGVHEADRVRDELGIDGTGITVGIMSDSYDDLGGAAADIASDDLPDGGVNVLQDLNDDGIDEGRAMAQLVHDLAPGADLAFSSVFFGQADFAQQIRDLADPAKGNADVLVDDIAYFAEPFFQDGVIAQAIDEVVTNEGVTYYSSAGNSADQSYESTDFAAAADSEEFFSNTFHDFDPSAGVDTRQSITIPEDATVLLSFQWDDPFYTTDGVDSDLNFFLLESGTNNVLAGSADANIVNQIPFEFIGLTNTSGSDLVVDLAITLFEGPEPEIIKYVNYGDDIIFNEFETNSSTVVGHPNATNAQAVAASPYFDPTNPEPFTSIGPSTIYFEPDGTRKATPEVRQTPEITAVDGTDTTFFGQDVDFNGFPNFFGTSAAAPHAAAISALIQEADPNLTPEQVYDVLADTATDIDAPGFDNVTGAGLIDAFAAVDSVLSPEENTPPVANNDTATTIQDQAVTIDVLANDTDADGDILEIVSFVATSSEGGTIALEDNDTPEDASDDQLTYTPAAGFTGSDAFEYTISDGLATDAAPVEISVLSDDETNIINGTPGRDNLTGTDGDDLITGGFGADNLTGGFGDDTFVYNDLRDRGDTITDFNLEGDQIDFSNLISNLGISSAQIGITDSPEGTFITLDSNNSGVFRNYILVQGQEVNADNVIFAD